MNKKKYDNFIFTMKKSSFPHETIPEFSTFLISTKLYRCTFTLVMQYHGMQRILSAEAIDLTPFQGKNHASGIKVVQKIRYW